MTVPATPKLSQVIAEFLAPATTKLSQFLRGGAYVPNTTPNNAVPTALPIRLLQMAGTVRHIPHTAVNVPDSSDKTGDKPGTIFDTVTCNPTNGTGPFTYSWSFVSTFGGSPSIDNPAAKTVNISRTVGGPAPTFSMGGTLFCVSTDTSNGYQVTSQTDVDWFWEEI
jgi:hypothetical protein